MQLRPEPRAAARMLVVDDSPDNRMILEANLIASGYEVELAEDGHRAIQLFQTSPPDLVLLDIMMPGLDGFATCRRLRALPGGDGVPIVFVTALGDLETHRAALESGADDFLPKPINRTELIVRVRSLLVLRELRRQLEHQNAALRRAQHERKEMIAHLVHDLRTPLMAVMNGANLVSKEPNLSERGGRSARSIARAAEAMHRLVGNMLDVATSEDGVLSPVLVSIDVQALVDDVLALMIPRAQDSGRQIERRVDTTLPPLLADADMIQRLLANLVDNALKYTPKGGTIVIDVASTGEALLIAVRDDGPGVPRDAREKIFDRYARLDRDRGERAGAGLGLAFCRLAATLHGGTIDVEDNHPRGACFRVVLPLRGSVGEDRATKTRTTAGR